MYSSFFIEYSLSTKNKELLFVSSTFDDSGQIDLLKPSRFEEVLAVRSYYQFELNPYFFSNCLPNKQIRYDLRRVCV